MMALVFAGLLVPFSIGTGTGTSLNPVVLLVPALTVLWLAENGLRIMLFDSVATAASISCSSSWLWLRFPTLWAYSPGSISTAQGQRRKSAG